MTLSRTKHPTLLIGPISVLEMQRPSSKQKTNDDFFFFFGPITLQVRDLSPRSMSIRCHGIGLLPSRKRGLDLRPNIIPWPRKYEITRWNVRRRNEASLLFLGGETSSAWAEFHFTEEMEEILFYSGQVKKFQRRSLKFLLYSLYNIRA